MLPLKEKIMNRLKACRAHQGWTFAETAAELAKITGAKFIPSRYGNWELGINTPPLDMMIALGTLFDKPPAYLAGLTDDDGKAPETRDYLVPAQSIVHSSKGLVTLGEKALAFHTIFLEKIKLDKTKALLIAAPDDSMAGIIEEGDLALIDRRETTVTRDDMFAILVGDRLWLRWVRQTLQGDYTVQAENRDGYPDQILTPEQLAELSILGRVRLIAHLR